MLSKEIVSSKQGSLVGWLVLVLWAAGLSLALFWVANYANSIFYIRWPLQGDTASYWVKDIALTSQRPGMESSHIEAGYDLPPSSELSNHRLRALHGAMQNGRDPARTAFFALLPEDAASSVNGHLPYSATAAFVYLTMLMVMLRRRTCSLVYALSASLVVLLPAGLLNPMYGLPSKLPDLPASFVFGAAVFAIFSSKCTRESELFWIFIAGLLLGLATLMRYQVWIYGVFTLGPIALICGIRRYFEHGKRVNDIVIYPLVLILGIGMVAGYFIVSNISDTLRYYSIVGYALNSSIYSSLQVTGWQFLQYIGIFALFVGALVMAAFVSFQYKLLSKINSWDVLVTGWALLAYPILLFIVMRVESIVEQTYYIVPGLTLFFLSPFSNRDEKNSGFDIFSICLAVIMPLAVLCNIFSFLNSEDFIYPRPRESEVAEFQHQLAELVAANCVPESGGRILTIDSNFSSYGRFIQPILRVKFNRNSKSLQLFAIRKGGWIFRYTGNEADDKRLIMNDLTNKVDIFMALTKPLPSAIKGAFADEYTEHLAEFVNQELAKNSSVWENKGSVIGPYGEATVYKNLAR